MSDPVTNVEIEDVLSSIRRLVSSDGRTPLTPAREAPKAPQKLVLTPALRVDDARPAPTAAPEAEPEAAGFQSESDHGTAVPADRSEWQDAADSAVTEEPEAEAVDALPDRSAELTARVAELEHIVARSTEEWEPDGQSSDAYSGGPVDPLQWEDYVPEMLDDPATDDQDTPAEPEHPTEAGAELTDAWEDDTPEEEEEEDLLDDDGDWDEAETDAEPAPQEARPTPPTDTARHDSALEGEDMLDYAEDVLDEDALRDLVAEIVRQELQGALGERITRNVRKLVRREIHRALTAQELE